ncbi:MAG: hypothetical protein ACK4KV_15155 [Rhodocyclaceae bacterium]
MVFDISIAMTWILFLALFPIAFFWLRRAWRIVVGRDFSEVALKRGVSPPDPARFAVFSAIINLLGGAIVICVIAAVLLGQVEYQVWSAIAGMTIWCKVFIDFGLARHAHGFAGGAKSKRAAASGSAGGHKA